MKIGVMVESFRKGFREGVEEARKLGADGIQAYLTDYGYIPWHTMTKDKIRETLDIVKSNGLVFSAICGDFGMGFQDEEQNKIFVERSKRILDIAKELECDIVTTHIGTVPPEECEKKEIMRRACRDLAIYADSMNSAFAVETGPEPGERLADFLDSLGAGGVRVNFDPANLVMVAGDRPENALKYLGKYIVHTHAKDGIKLEKGTHPDASLVIGDEAKGHDALMEMGYSYLELPLGQGDVDFDIYLPELSATGFDGFLTIEREVGANPSADIGMAAEFLREKLALHNIK